MLPMSFAPRPSAAVMALSGRSCAAVGDTVGGGFVGGIVGVWTAHLMFELPLWQLSMTARTGPGQWLAEAVATFGLVLTILGCIARTPAAVPYAVGLYITAAYWFTSSTSFANPAVAIARSMTNTFSGIRPIDLPGFIAAELCGAVVALLLMNWLLRTRGERTAEMKEAKG